MKDLINRLLGQVEYDLRLINKARLRISERAALERALARINAVKQIIYVTGITITQ